MGSKGSAWSNLLAVMLTRLARPFQGRGKNVVAAVGLLAMLLLGPYFAWLKWGPSLTSHERFLLSAERIVVSPQPSWIHTDVRDEVIRDARLDELHVLDEQVTVKVANAFALHNWVAEVKRVSKHPGPRVAVELVYRRPVAMVEVSRGGARGLLPIDQLGVLLPTEDFSPVQTRNYLRVSAGDTAPAGVTGRDWGDERIAGAAKLAALLEAEWRRLGLYRIVAVGDRESSRRKGGILYELQSRKGARVVWGHAPGAETRGEASGSEKLARLEEYVEQNGPFDATTAEVALDLREGLSTVIAPKGAPTKPTVARPDAVNGSVPEMAVPGGRLVPVSP